MLVAVPIVGAAVEKEDLRPRVEARWTALIAGDFGKAYEFETPAYRAVYTPPQFKTQFGRQMTWRVANILDIHYDGSDVARVDVEVAYHYAEPEVKDSPVLDMTSVSKEIWLHKEGQWWHQQQD